MKVNPRMLTMNPNRIRDREMARRIMVLENIVRTRVESGPAFDIREELHGTRLSHDEFLWLARLAMPLLNKALSEE